MFVSIKLQNSHFHGISSEPSVPIFDGFTMPPDNHDPERNALYKQLQCRPRQAGTCTKGKAKPARPRRCFSWPNLQVVNMIPYVPSYIILIFHYIKFIVLTISYSYIHSHISLYHIFTYIHSHISRCDYIIYSYIHIYS